MKAKQTPWQDLQFFLATARSGSLSAAALELEVNASTVMRRIRQLETRFGVRLFDRSPRGYALTPAGIEFYEHILAVEAGVLAAERKVANRDQSLSGVIRVATVDDLLHMLLAPILGNFRRQHPGVELDLSIHSDHADLGRRQADVAIRPGLSPKTADVIPKRVCAVGVALYASHRYLEDYGKPDSLEALRQHAIVRANEERAHMPMERFIDQYVTLGNVAFRSNSMLARLAAVREGIGVGMLPCFAADHEPSLQRIGSVPPDISSSLWIVMHADLRSNARLRTFVEFIHAALLKKKDRLEGVL